MYIRRRFLLEMMVIDYKHDVGQSPSAMHDAHHTSCLIFNFRAATIAHLMSSSVSSNCSGKSIFDYVSTRGTERIEAYLEVLNGLRVDNNANISILGSPRLLKHRRNL